MKQTALTIVEAGCDRCGRRWCHGGSRKRPTVYCDHCRICRDASTPGCTTEGADGPG